MKKPYNRLKSSSGYHTNKQLLVTLSKSAESISVRYCACRLQSYNHNGPTKKSIRKELEINVTTQPEEEAIKLHWPTVKEWWACSYASDVVNVFVTISCYHMYYSYVHHTLSSPSCIPFYMPQRCVYVSLFVTCMLFFLSSHTKLWLRLAAVESIPFESFPINVCMNVKLKQALFQSYSPFRTIHFSGIFDSWLFLVIKCTMLILKICKFFRLRPRFPTEPGLFFLLNLWYF